MANYYVSHSGTEPFATATTPATPADVAAFNSAHAGILQDGDVVHFMGTFLLGSETITIAKGGSDENNRIVYKSYDGDPAILDGEGKDTYVTGGGSQLINVNGVPFVELDGFTLENVDSSGSSGGEAVYWSAPGGIMKNCTFQNYVQPASAGGGAWIEYVLATGQTSTIEDCIFGWATDEAVSSHAGIADSFPTLRRCNFVGCGSGMALQWTQLPSLALFEDCNFIGDATCGAYPSIPTGLLKDRTVFRRCKFEYAVAGAGLAGTYEYCIFRNMYTLLNFNGTNAGKFINCIFDRGATTGNYAFLGYNDNMDLTLENCFFRNFGAAIYFNGRDNLFNLTMVNNRYTNQSNGFALLGGATDLSEANVSNNNEVADPLFADAASGDYSLQAGSPLIDAGISTPEISYPATDLAGNIVPWPQGGTPDIGAYEYGSQASYASPPMLAPIADLVLQVDDAFTPIQAVNNGGAATSWSLNQAALDAGLAVDASGLITWPTPTATAGLSTTVTATNAAGSDAETFLITVQQETQMAGKQIKDFTLGLPATDAGLIYQENGTTKRTGAALLSKNRLGVFPKTWKALLAQSQISVLALGDSLGMGVFGNIRIPFEQTLGGQAGEFNFNQATLTLGGGLSLTQNVYSDWPDGNVFDVGTGQSLAFTRTADQFKFYYIREPGAGSFKVQINDVDVAGFETIDADHTSREVGIVTIDTALASQEVKLVGISGTVRVFGWGWKNTTASGLITGLVYKGGVGMHLMDQTPALHLNTVLRDFGFDLAMLSDDMSDAPASGTVNEMTTVLESYLGKVKTATTPTGGVPADMIIISRPPTSLKPADDQRQAFARAAQSLGAIFYDGYEPFRDAATVAALGWDGDGIHPDADAWAYLSDLFWKDFSPYLGLTLPTAGALRSSEVEIIAGSNTVGRLKGGAFNSDLQIDMQTGNRSLKVMNADGTTVEFQTQLQGQPAKIRGPFIIEAGGTAPASSSSTGTPGTILFNSAAGYIYMCRATDTWVRIGASGLETSW